MPSTTLENPWAQGINSLGSIFDPERRAKANLMRQQGNAAALDAQKTQAEIDALDRRGGGEKSLAELFGRPGAVVTGPNGEVSISPAVASEFFSSYGQSRPNSPLMDAFDVMNRQPDAVQKHRQSIEAQAAKPPTMSEVEAIAFQKLTPAEQRMKVGPGIIPIQAGGHYIMPRGAKEVYPETALSPDLPVKADLDMQNSGSIPDLFGTGSAPLSPEQHQGAITLGTQLGEKLQGTPLAQIFASLTQAQQAAPHATEFSNDAGLGYVPKAEMVRSPVADAVSPYRNADGALLAEPYDPGTGQQPIVEQAPPAQPQQSLASVVSPEPETRQMGGGVTWTGNVLSGPPKGSSVESQMRMRPIPQAAAGGMISDMDTLNKIDRAIELVRRNPDSLGIKNMAGDFAIQRLNPEGVETRAALATVGNTVLHDISGAAVTVPEWERNRVNIANSKDTPEAALQKLQLMREYLTGHLQTGSKFYSPAGGYVVDPSVSHVISKFAPQEAAPSPVVSAIGQPPAQVAQQPTAVQAEAMRALEAIKRGANPEAIKARFKERTGQDL